MDSELKNKTCWPVHWFCVFMSALLVPSYMSDIKKEDSVTPCLRWAMQIPCLGKIPALAFHMFESFFVCLVLRKTGDQLFLRDRPQIIVDMGSHDRANSRAPDCCTKPRPVDASGCHSKVPYVLPPLSLTHTHTHSLLSSRSYEINAQKVAKTIIAGRSKKNAALTKGFFTSLSLSLT